MKSALSLFLLVAFTGCGTLLPKKVEFFQKKVQAVPVASDSAKESERQAAALASVRAEQTLIAAVEASSPTNVLGPAKDSKVLTRAVSTSLGPPKSVYFGSATNLAAKVESNAAKLNRKVDDYSEKVTPLVGKKIEGTGFFRIGYFTYIGLILLLLVIAWGALKIYGMANPLVGLGTNVVGRIGGRTVAAGYSQVVKGNEIFKEELANSGIEAAIAEKVKELFAASQARAQDKEHQEIIKSLTVKPSQV